MVIDRIDITPCIMPNKDREWRFALATISDNMAWIVSIYADNGQVGHGYAQAFPYLGASYNTVKGALDLFVPLLTGKDPFAIDARLGELDRALLDNNQAKAGIDSALYDLKAKSLNIPVYELLGGKARQSIPQLRILPVKTPAEMALSAQRLVEEGYSYLKIKALGNMKEDVERVRAIRKQVGPDIHLMVDANQSYEPKSAIQAIRRMEEFQIDIVEQPVPIHDLKGLELVTHSVDTVVEADESARSISDVMTLAANRMVDAIAIKIPKMGGLRRCRMIADICAAAGVKYRVGALVGSQVLAAAGLHFAAASPGIWYACELAQYDELLDDPFEGIEVKRGEMPVSDAIGLGVRLKG
jgi:L-alanine-DL-glutamate epimerase-like enolase superfamily enzyme